MKHFLIYTNKYKDKELKTTEKIKKYLTDRGQKVTVKEAEWKNKTSNLTDAMAEAGDIPADVDYMIVLGGDGTILEAARRAAVRGTPILGINLGRLGYMAELEPSELDLLGKLFTGEYELEERSMLRVELYAGGELRSFCYALNDAVISNGSVSRMIELELSEGGSPVTTYRADGLIIATPTGSTAYSMSAGGALVDPRVPCVCVTPICPHSFIARPMIFSDDALLEVRNVCAREKMLYLTVDGRMNFELYRNQVVRVTKANIKTKLIRLKSYGFYRKLRQKMNSSGQA